MVAGPGDEVGPRVAAVALLSVSCPIFLPAISATGTATLFLFSSFSFLFLFGRMFFHWKLSFGRTVLFLNKSGRRSMTIDDDDVRVTVENSCENSREKNITREMIIKIKPLTRHHHSSSYRLIDLRTSLARSSNPR